MNTGQIDTESFQLAPLIPINDSTSEMEQSYEMSPSEMLVNVSNLLILISKVQRLDKRGGKGDGRPPWNSEYQPFF